MRMRVARQPGPARRVAPLRRRTLLPSVAARPAGTPWRRRLLTLLLFAAGVLTLGLIAAAPASAHASVVSTDPADGARLTSAPGAVTVTFDEAVQLGGGAYLHVVDAHGSRVDAGAATHPGGDDTKISVSLRTGLGAGGYTASFRVVSADSHPVTGALRFAVGDAELPPVTGATSAGAAGSGGTSAVFDVVRWVSYVGVALLGGLWLLLTIWPAGRDERRVRHILWTGWVLAVFGALAELALQGPYAAGRGLSGVTDGGLLDATLHSDYGTYHSIRLLLLAGLALVLAALLHGPPSRQRASAAFGWPLLIGLPITFSATGHAATTDPTWVSVPADVLHMSAMAAWVGGLVLVLAVLLPRNDRDELRAVLPGFSRVAFGSVLVLALTGAWAAWHGVGTPRAALTTSYGLLVLAKIALFVGLILLGDYSRRAIQRRLVTRRVAYAMADTEVSAAPVRDGGGLTSYEHGRMRRSVLVEVALAALVLAATAVLVDQPRGAETVAARDREPVQGVALIGPDRTVVLTLDPGVHGPVTGTLTLGPGVVPQQVSATIAQPEHRFGPLPLKLRPDGVDRYALDEIALPYRGTWIVAVTVTTSNFDAVTADVTITLH